MQSNGKDSQGEIENERHKQELHVITIVISVVLAVVVVAGVGGFILWRMRRQRKRKRDSEEQIIEKQLSENTDTSDDGSIDHSKAVAEAPPFEQHASFNSLVQSNATVPAVPSAVSHSISSEKELRDVMYLQSAPESVPSTMQDPSAPSVDDELSDASSVAIAGHSGGHLPAQLATSLPPDTKLEPVNEEVTATSQDWSDADRKDATLFSVTASEPTSSVPLTSPSAPPAYYREGQDSHVATTESPSPNTNPSDKHTDHSSTIV